MTNTTENQVRTEVNAGLISCDKVYSATYQKEGSMTAQLRQVITTSKFYPTTKYTNEMEDNPFANELGGGSEKEYANEQTRVTWINVPVGTTPEQVTEKVKNGKLVQTISNSPILTNDQKYAIDNGLKTMDDYAKSQIIQKNENGVLEIVKDAEGKFQYKVNNFKMDKNAPDVDLRGTTEEYIPSWINEEIQAVGNM